MYQNLETIDELANRWKVKKSWIYAKTRDTGEGSIPRIKVGKYLRFVPAEADLWLKMQNEAE
jgi:hypothetical protein